MIKYNDWSDLVTVRYRGGMGGDFFSYLLDNCFSNNASFNHDKNYKYDFYDADAFYLRFKSLHDYFTSLKKEPNPNSQYSMDTFSLHSRIYVENDVNQIIDNLRNVIIDDFSYRFDRKRVASMHFYSEDGTALQDLFPGSQNIFLGSENQSYNLITNFLFIYKMALVAAKIVDDKVVVSYSMADHHYDTIENFVDKLLVLYKSKENKELPIDMYELIVAGKSYDGELSELCGTKIVLNQDRIKTYRNQSVEILSQFGINIDGQYDYFTFRSLVVDAVKKILRERSNG